MSVLSPEVIVISKEITPLCCGVKFKTFEVSFPAKFVPDFSLNHERRIGLVVVTLIVELSTGIVLSYISCISRVRA